MTGSFNPTPPESASRLQRTLLLDGGRGVSDGFAQSVLQTTGLVIAVQAFSVSDQVTALIASAPFIGNLVSLFYAALLSASHRSKSTLAAAPLFGSALCFLCASRCDQGTSFAIWLSLAIVLFQLRLTFLTAIYRENYPRGRRGVLFSRGLILMTVSSLVVTFGYGRALQFDLENFRWLMLGTALSTLAGALCVAAFPSSPPVALRSGNPLRNLGLLRSQPLFGYILCAWFIFGFANLWVQPLRAIYVAKPDGGLGLDPFTASLVLGVSLETGRLVSTPIWARLFDRINFIALRIVLNAFLGAGLVVFFATLNPWIVALGSFLVGICTGGGSLAWNLWVTHFAPPEETHIYMSVHSFLTGVRGVIGPHIAVLCLGSLGMNQIGWISGGLVLVSMVMLGFAFPMLDRHKRSAEAENLA